MKTSWGNEVGSRSSFAPADCWAVRRGEAYLVADKADIACAHLHQPIRAPSLCAPIIACRYVGDRIALIFPEAPREAIVMRINQLRQAIFALSLEHFGRRLEKISASFGVSLFPLHGKTAADLLRAAEVALASARDFGNNRVQVAD